MKLNLVIIAMVAAMLFPIGAQSDPGRTVSRKMVKQVEKVREADSIEKQCKVERIVSKEPKRPVRKLINKLRLRKK